MEDPPITVLLRRYQSGDLDALGELSEVVYDELRAIARSKLGHRGMLNPTTLVHETFLKLLDNQALAVNDRQHFFALSAKIMRQVIVDAARASLTGKRRHHEVPLDEEHAAEPTADPAFLLDLERALEQMGDEDERLVHVFECRYFAGMTAEETASATGVSVATVERDWRTARTRLRAILDDSRSSNPD